MDTQKEYCKAPFPYFGGKSKVAQIVWNALGDVKHYLEPFFGSGAVLLLRPNYDYKRHIETICNKNGFVANAWRALKYAPDEVAYYADYPVSHIDMTARENKLYETKDELVVKLAEDEEYYDAKLAGYWIWGMCCSIGLDFGGWKHNIYEGKIGRRPQISRSGAGIHSSTNRTLDEIPFLSREGKDVNSLSIRDDIVDDIMPVNTKIYDWFRFLANRLRYVRIVCGDWKRICGGDWQNLRNNTNLFGIFFDPPYCNKNRKEIYIEDDFSVAKEVEQWAIERGKRENYRIVIAGYEEDYPHLVGNGWGMYRWSTTGGLANTSNRKTQGKINKDKECLFFSPYCLNHGGLL